MLDEMRKAREAAANAEAESRLLKIELEKERQVPLLSSVLRPRHMLSHPVHVSIIPPPLTSSTCAHAPQALALQEQSCDFLVRESAKLKTASQRVRRAGEAQPPQCTSAFLSGATCHSDANHRSACSPLLLTSRHETRWCTLSTSPRSVAPSKVPGARSAGLSSARESRMRGAVEMLQSEHPAQHRHFSLGRRENKRLENENDQNKLTKAPPRLLPSRPAALDALTPNALHPSTRSRPFHPINCPCRPHSRRKHACHRTGRRQVMSKFMIRKMREKLSIVQDGHKQSELVEQAT